MTAPLTPLTLEAWYHAPEAQQIIRSLIANPPALVERSANYVTSTDRWDACEHDDRTARLSRICDDAFLAAENAAPGGPNSPEAQRVRNAFLSGPLADDVVEAIIPEHRRRVLWNTVQGDPAVIAGLREEFGLIARRVAELRGVAA